MLTVVRSHDADADADADIPILLSSVLCGGAWSSCSDCGWHHHWDDPGQHQPHHHHHHQHHQHHHHRDDTVSINLFNLAIVIKVINLSFLSPQISFSHLYLD